MTALPAEVDVLIVGGGPAGLSAATVLAPHLRVLVLDREAMAGGIPRHCGHPPFGMREFGRVLRGPDYAAALVARARAAGVQIACGVDVTALHPGPAVSVTSDAGPARIAARRVLLATGVREGSRVERMIGGEKPGGILPTGALQGMVHLEGRRPFLRPVILGTELVAFSAIMTCAHAGIRPVAMIEEGPRATARWPAALYPRLRGIALHLGTRVLAIEGRERVESVLIDGPAGQQRIAADGVILSGRFRPEATLLVTGHLARDRATGGPAIDSAGRCSDPDFHAAGNLLRPVETAGWCWDEGRRVAGAILADLRGAPPPAPESPSRSAPLPVTLGPGPLSWVVPQAVVLGAGAFGHLQLRVERPARGRLVLRAGGAVIAGRRIASRPERRILLPLPPDLPAGGGLSVTLEEG
ncbi:MAG: FAD-dependent oxidoreductase [Rubellimicrobium sp.]|nr:FAD-dependent oxidoreductase [Rubellimicrobium sp.]